jgi:hypothetical protein
MPDGPSRGFSMNIRLLMDNIPQSLIFSDLSDIFPFNLRSTLFIQFFSGGPCVARVLGRRRHGFGGR